MRLLSEAEVAEYLKRRVPGGVSTHPSLPLVTHVIHQRTEGNPLFMVNVVVEVLTREQLDGAMVERQIPETIRQMIELLLERCSAEEQRVLEVASVVGGEFSAAIRIADKATPSAPFQPRRLRPPLCLDALLHAEFGLPPRET